MCGIIGYIGKSKAAPILLDGLRRMEYRGYDSAGMAVISGNKILMEKCAGKIDVLAERLSGSNQLWNTESFCGLSHSRWATHGLPNEVNAHPHFDCTETLAVVHNGIIENYQGLKHYLESQGHHFKSETDTEVIAHLIEEYSRELPYEEAVTEALRHLHGTFGLTIISREHPDKLIGARLGSPLILGVAEDGILIASDVAALLPYTRDVIYLDDGEVVFAEKKLETRFSPLSQHETGFHYRIVTLENRVVSKKLERVPYTLEQAEKGGYPHFMLKEIFEQPEALRNSLRGRIMPEEGLVRLGGLHSVEAKLRQIKNLIIVSCGTSYYAGLIGKYLIEKLTGLPVNVDLASEFRYRDQEFPPNSAAVFISQSGETADTLAALRECKRRGLLTLGIVNVVGSSIARETDAGVYNHIGPEIGVASTKAFVSQLAILALLGVYLGRMRNLSVSEAQGFLNELTRLPEKMQTILSRADEARELASIYNMYSNFLFLGRNANYPIALEGALKLKEISYIHAEGYAAGEMKHGPIAMIDQDFPSVFVVPQDGVYNKNLSNMEEIRARRGPLIAIATAGDDFIRKIANHVLYIPKTLDAFTPFLSVVPLQLFAYYMGVQKDYDVDKPRNLAKSVTVE